MQEVGEDVAKHIPYRVGRGKYSADRKQKVEKSARKDGKQYRKRIDAELKQDINREIAERVGKRQSRGVAADLRDVDRVAESEGDGVAEGDQSRAEKVPDKELIAK